MAGGGVNETGERVSQETVLILAPFGQDAALMATALKDAGFSPLVEPNADSFASHLADSGCAIITAEALESSALHRVTEVLNRQPAWSDIPLVVLCARSTPPQFDEAVRSLGNVTAVQRPLSPASLITVVRSALRARRRQHEVRRLLEEGQYQQSRIEALNERLQRAMTETHHRVKNNLQVVAALADMRVMDSDGSVPVEEVQRIATLTHSLSVVHDILTHQAKEDGHAHSVTSRAVLEKLVEVLRTSTPHRKITLDADDTRFTSRQGTSLALVLSELVGNSIKHGRGEVWVEFRVLSDSARLTIRDEGPGFPPDFDAKRSMNTGLELVDNLARWDLGGTITYENGPEGGASVSLTIPHPTDTSNDSVSA